MIMRGRTWGSGSNLVSAIMLLLVVGMREVGACSAGISSDPIISDECQASPPPPPPPPPELDTCPPRQIRHDSCSSGGDHHQTSCSGGCRVPPLASPCQACPPTKCGAQNRGPSCADHCSEAPISDACCCQATSTKCSPQPTYHSSDVQRDPCHPSPLRCGQAASDPCQATAAKCGATCNNNNNNVQPPCHNSDPCKASTKCSTQACQISDCERPCLTSCCCPSKRPSPPPPAPSCCGVPAHKA